MELTTVLRRDVGRDSTRRAVDDKWPFAAFEDKICGKCQRQFLANITAIIVNNCQAIGIWILSKPSVSLVLNHGFAKIAEIF